VKVNPPHYRIPESFDSGYLVTELASGVRVTLGRVGIPPFRSAPRVLIWRDRAFVRSELDLDTWVEAFAYAVPEHHVDVRPPTPNLKAPDPGGENA